MKWLEKINVLRFIVTVDEGFEELEFNPLIANPIKWPNTFKQFVGKLPTNCLSVFGHFVNFALKRLTVPSSLIYLIFSFITKRFGLIVDFCVNVMYDLQKKNVASEDEIITE